MMVDVCFPLSLTLRWELLHASTLNYGGEKSAKNNQDQTMKLIKITERDLKNQFNKATHLLLRRFSLFHAFLCPTQMQSLKLEPFFLCYFHWIAAHAGK